MLKELRQSLARKSKAIKIAKEVRKVPCKMYFYNWWTPQTTDAWFYRFAEHRGLLNTTSKQVAFFSVFGPREVLDFDDSAIKIFYTGENLELYSEYADHCLERKDIDLALGFEYLDNPRYLRSPIWLRTQFRPEWNETQILQHIQELRYPSINGKDRFCAMVASHDDNGVRRQMVEALSQVDTISCAGSFMHNDDSLQTVFGNDKNEYLKHFWLNICPENSDAEGYVTEKIFDAVRAGCIPVYWGAGGSPEPNILNRAAFLTWPDDVDNGRIIEVCSSESAMADFASQPRLLENAEAEIITMLDRLQNSLRNLLE